jgi:hypothetical protein
MPVSLWTLPDAFGYLSSLLQKYPTSWIDHVKQRAQELAEIEPALATLPMLVKAEFDRLKALHVSSRHGPPQRHTREWSNP